MSWAAVAGAAIGAVGSSMKSDGGSQEQKREPWGPAVPWLTQNLKTGQDLQGFYQKNPFSDQQKIGMQNQLGMADQFNSQMMPGLMDFANKGMTSSYQRGAGGAPGSMAGYGGAQRQPGLLSSGAGPFSAPKTQGFGLIDWDAQNPYSKNNPNGIGGTPAPAAAQASTGMGLEGLTPEQLEKLLIMLSGDDGYGGYGGGDGVGGTD
jgi:hypothetical protein